MNQSYIRLFFRILIREREMTFTKELQIIRSDKKEGNFDTFVKKDFFFSKVKLSCTCATLTRIQQKKIGAC